MGQSRAGCPAIHLEDIAPALRVYSRVHAEDGLATSREGHRSPRTGQVNLLRRWDRELVRRGRQ
jgi:hypothetical protein